MILQEGGRVDGKSGKRAVFNQYGDSKLVKGPALIVGKAPLYRTNIREYFRMEGPVGRPFVPTN